MRVEIKIQPELSETYAVIHARSLTEEVKQTAEMIEARGSMLTVREEDKIVILDKEEVYMVRAENKGVIIYGEKKKHDTAKKLYELQNILGENFMRISKSTIVNLKKIACVEPSFHGMMYVVLKNGNKDYITRTYMAQFKQYLGL